jgi:hypothetical protein
MFESAVNLPVSNHLDESPAAADDSGSSEHDRMGVGFTVTTLTAAASQVQLFHS